jgi:hypothetical protein
MTDKGFSTVNIEQCLEVINRQYSAEERKEIYRQMGQYLLEGVIDD